MANSAKKQYWFPEDSEWMKERKKLWRKVKYNLNLFSRFSPYLKKKVHKYHQELFFFGVVNDRAARRELCGECDYQLLLATGFEAFCYNLPVFQLWYHPHPSELDISLMRDRYIQFGDLETSRADILNLYGHQAGGEGWSFCPVYGMMGGREEWVVEYFFPKLDYRELIPYSQPHRKGGHPPCENPSVTRDICLQGTFTELRKDALFYPYAFGQYLWDHLAFALEKYPDEVLSGGLKKEPHISDPRRAILVVMSEVLSFEQRTDSSRRRPSTIAMVERLIQKYERKEFSPSLLKLWDEAKSTSPTDEERGVFDIGYDRVNGRNNEVDFTSKKQEEWKSRWAQI